MTIDLGQFISFRDADGRPIDRYRYQNYFIGQSNAGHDYLGFIVEAGVGTTSGDRPQTTFSTARNEISANIVSECVDGFWSMRVETWFVDPEQRKRLRLFIDETWLCSSYAQDDAEDRILTVNLSSPFDAIGTQIPPLLLTEERCGALPAPGSINIG
jgi:hypothetical protein